MKKRAAKPAGIALVMVAASITALMGFAALGIDLAFLMEAQGELSSAADATAIAAASGLTASPQEDAKKAEALSRAQTYAALNKVLGQGINLNSQAAPLDFGRWDTGKREFELGATPTNAVRVSFELTGSTIPAAPQLFFAPVLGQGTGRIAASATAALVGSRDIVLALDRSGSMNDDGLNPEQPLTDTKNAAKDFVDLLDPEGDQVGLVFYSDSAILSKQLTENFTTVKAAISDPKVNAVGHTNIAAALCRARLESTSSHANEGAVPVIVLLSDGKTNTQIKPSSSDPCRACTPTTNPSCGYDSDTVTASCEAPVGGLPLGGLTTSEQQALDQAKQIAKSSVVLYTISLGCKTNQALMEQMAKETGGEHFFAPTTADLEAIFIEISQKIPAVLVQ